MTLTTLNSVSTPTHGVGRSDMIRRVISRQGYTVDASGMAFFSSEDGGHPIGTFAELELLIEAYGCLGERDSDGTYRSLDANACAALDRALFERALSAPTAA